MIVRDFYRTREDGVNLYRTYSDEGMLILQNETNIKYAEAIDVENTSYIYTETDEPIPTDGDNELAEKAKAYDILMGVEV